MIFFFFHSPNLLEFSIIPSASLEYFDLLSESFSLPPLGIQISLFPLFVALPQITSNYKSKFVLFKLIALNTTSGTALDGNYVTFTLAPFFVPCPYPYLFSLKCPYLLLTGLVTRWIFNSIFFLSCHLLLPPSRLGKTCSLGPLPTFFRFYSSDQTQREPTRTCRQF